MGQVPQPTERELAILKVLWDRGEATVQEVYRTLRDELPIVQNTVQAFLRTMDSWLLILVAIIIWYVLWFPVRLSRNTLLYIILFGVYFLSTTVGLFVATQLSLYQGRGVSSAALTVSWVCLAGWLVALGGRGGHTTSVIGHWWNREKAERLTAQLDRINERLERMGR